MKSQSSGARHSNPSSPQDPLETSAPKNRAVEPHRQCALCYSGPLNGVGREYSKKGPTAYYKCDRCGYTWTVKKHLTIKEVVHREIDVRQRRP